MPEVTIENLHSKAIHCKSKTEKLLDILLSETDWMHACGMKGNCTTCKAIILSGSNHLSKLTDFEKKFLRLGKLEKGERLSCQALVHGNLSIKVPQAFKLPHIDYSD